MNRFNCEAAVKWIMAFVLFVFLGGRATSPFSPGFYWHSLKSG